MDRIAGLSAGGHRRNAARSLPARVGGDSRRRLRLARPGRRRHASKTTRPTSRSPMPGTAGFGNIPSARCRRPWSWSPAWTVPSSAAAGRQPGEATTDQALRENRSSAPSSTPSVPFCPRHFRDFAAVGLGETPFGVIEHVVPTLAPLLLRAERTALLRRLHELANQSKAGRLVRQLGEHGRSLWNGLKARRHAQTKSG